jgi:hypothetical protein
VRPPSLDSRVVPAGFAGDRGQTNDTDGRIAQLVEQLTLNQRAQGSSPCAPTIFRTAPTVPKKPGLEPGFLFAFNVTLSVCR